MPDPARRWRGPFLCLSLVICWLSATTALAVPPPPADLPSDRAALGTAFVESWLSFRRELDTMAHLPVHPGMLDGWFEGAPRFLLRDAVSMAAEPRVIVAAARALARGADDEDRALLALRERRAAGSPLADELWAYRIRARDARALERARSGLADPRLVVRERAAFVMAAAGRKEGLSTLREIAEAHGEESLPALRGLGSFGAAVDLRLLERIAGDRGDPEAALAGRGEIALRRAFPHHHLALLNRDSASSRLRVAGGLYDAWFTALHRALDSPARASAAVRAHLELQRKEAVGEKLEPLRRNLTALIEFWEYTDQRLAATAAAPPWPGSMEQALALVREGRGPRESPGAAARRVSAMIAASAWSGGALGHRGGAVVPRGTRSLSPAGDRALDGSFATAFHLPPGGRLVLELPPGSRPREIGVAAGCPGGAGPRLRRIQVDVADRGSSRSFAADLTGDARYFQAVALDGGPARRLEIRALEIDGDGPACIVEVRVP